MINTKPNNPPAAAKRGRPEMLPARRAEMRAKIAASALALFQENSFASVSMRRIAKDIGVTPMTLYGYYDAKIDILRSLWGGVFEQLFARLRALPNETVDRDYLASLCTAYIQFWLERPDYYRLVFMAEGVTQPDVSLFVGNPEILSQYSLFAETLAVVCAGSETSEDMKCKLDFLLCALHGISHNHITISGYLWAPIEPQVAMAIRGIL